MYWRQGKWKKCTAETGTEQWRSGRNNDFQYTDSETRLAEYRNYFKGPHKDKTSAERNGFAPTCLCQRNTGT